MKDIITLSMESSCDETAVAILRNGREVLANVVSTQIELHKKFGGVVPEVASRKHIENIDAVFQEAIDEANIKLEDIEVKGITEVKLDTIKESKKENEKLKLIGRVYIEDNMVKAYVRPIKIKEDHPLYFVDYKNKGVFFKTDSLGDISIIGGASGTRNAAASILRDLVLVKSLE